MHIKSWNHYAYDNSGGFSKQTGPHVLVPDQECRRIKGLQAVVTGPVLTNDVPDTMSGRAGSRLDRGRCSGKQGVDEPVFEINSRCQLFSQFRKMLG